MKKGGTFFSRASLTRLSLVVTGPCLEKGNATTPFEKRDDVEEGSANDEEEEDDDDDEDDRQASARGGKRRGRIVMATREGGFPRYF
jgi:hypothetical protein